MNVKSGARLGPYEVLVHLGEGGMGDVWRARDTRLGREIALKLLPPAFAAEPERLARFEREARLLASLNHPGIAHLYEFEAAPLPDGTTAHVLVMELAEGEDLAERMKRGRIPLEEALPIARQVAEALEAAHEKGIVHRDLKPQNVKLGPDGTVKVLDFGLAKALDPRAASGGEAVGPSAATESPTLMNSPTLTSTGTAVGVILGTAAYMAPEQAKGLAVDRRADVWAFGVLMWEMLAGRRLFEGDSVAETLASVLKGPIELSALPASTPAQLKQLLRRCLERNPKNRLHDAADARLVLVDLEAGVADEAPAVAAAPPPRDRRRELVAWGFAAVALVAAGGLLLGRGSDEPVVPRVIRATLPLPAGVSIELDGERAGMPAVSPDGRRVAFGAREGSGPMRIWVHDLGTAVARPLPGTEEGYRPFWSPDGRRIGFFTWGHLATTPAEGGAVARLAPARDSRGGSWSPNGTILFAPFATGPLLAISERGGEAREVSGRREALGTGTHRFPQFLPDGEHFVFLDRSGRVGAVAGGVLLGKLGETGPARRLLEGATNAIYADGHLLFVRDGALVAQPFDLKSLALSGEPRVLVGDLLFNRRFAYGVFSASEAGVLVFLTGKQRDLSRLVWRDRSGRRLGELGTPGILSGFGGLALSRDGRWAAVGRVDEAQSDADVWLYDIVRGTETRLARPGSDESDPLFSPDGGTLYFGSAGDEGSAVVRRDLASGAETTLFSSKETYSTGPMSISPDGAAMACEERSRLAYADLVLRPLHGEGVTKVLVRSPSDDSYGQISPDGRWLLWASDDSGRYEVYVAPFPGGGSRVQVSREGGTQPRWAPAGGEILFKTPGNVLTAVRIETTSGTISVGTPTPLFPIVEFTGWTYDVTADGQRFLVREPMAEGDASPLTLLTDWTALARTR